MLFGINGLNSNNNDMSQSGFFFWFYEYDYNIALITTGSFLCIPTLPNQYFE